MLSVVDAESCRKANDLPTCIKKHPFRPVRLMPPCFTVYGPAAITDPSCRYNPPCDREATTIHVLDLNSLDRPVRPSVGGGHHSAAEAPATLSRRPFEGKSVEDYRAQECPSKAQRGSTLGVTGVSDHILRSGAGPLELFEDIWHRVAPYGAVGVIDAINVDGHDLVVAQEPE